MVAHTRNPELGEQDQGISGTHLPSSLVYLTSSSLMRDIVSNRRWGQEDGERHFSPTLMT